MAFYVFCDDNCRYEGMTKEQIIAAIAEATGSAPTAIDDAFITKLKEIRAGDTAQLWIGTEADFNAISPAPSVNKSPVRIGTDGIMYICTDDSMGGYIDAVLTADGWSDNLQTISVPSLPDNKPCIIGLAMSATDEQEDAAVAAGLRVVDRADGSITVKAKGTVPTVDLPVEIQVWG